MKTLLNQKWTAILVSISATTAIVLSLTAFSINLLDEYGFILFMMVPFSLGLMSTLIYGHYENRTFRETLGISFYTLLVVCTGLIIIKIEGILCVIMASPFVTVFTLLGATVGHQFPKRTRKTVIRVLSLNVLAIPIMMGVETKVFTDTFGLIKVNTAITIEAPVEKVWENVIVFPPISEPDELIFKTGIAYPTSSEIVGTGEGAIRYCEFTTGRFVEPIEVWDAPYRLQFSVMEQPAPLKDMLSEEVPGNMYKYFASTKGEFKLRQIDESTTLLEGNTWYYHKIRPAGYWRFWSDFIIHAIHTRVLKHIKIVSEK